MLHRPDNGFFQRREDPDFPGKTLVSAGRYAILAVCAEIDAYSQLEIMLVDNL
jgi:hypothetical protein